MLHEFDAWGCVCPGCAKVMRDKCASIWHRALLRRHIQGVNVNGRYTNGQFSSRKEQGVWCVSWWPAGPFWKRQKKARWEERAQRF
mgnify:CR=1 FL=1